MANHATSVKGRTRAAASHDTDGPFTNSRPCLSSIKESIATPEDDMVTVRRGGRWA